MNVRRVYEVFIVAREMGLKYFLTDRRKVHVTCYGFSETQEGGVQKIKTCYEEGS